MVGFGDELVILGTVDLPVREYPETYPAEDV